MNKIKQPLIFLVFTSVLSSCNGGGTSGTGVTGSSSIAESNPFCGQLINNNLEFPTTVCTEDASIIVDTDDSGKFAINLPSEKETITLQVNCGATTAANTEISQDKDNHFISNNINIVTEVSCEIANEPQTTMEEK